MNLKPFYFLTKFIVVGFLGGLSAAPVEAQITCGAVLSTDTILTNDLACPGTALTIGADGITVNLNGHTISGDGFTVGTAGIMINGYHDVTIKNGTVTRFFRGVLLAAASNNTIETLTVDGNFLSGIWLENGSDNNQIIGCVITNNGTDAHRGNGISINGSNGNLVTRTFAAHNFTQGIFVGGGSNTAPSSFSRILNNISENNVSNGIGIIGGSGHSVADNDTRNNGGNGVSFSLLPLPGPVTNSSILNNNITANALNGIGITNSHDNVIVGNRINGNVINGVSFNNSDGNTIIGNRVQRSGASGIAVRSGSDSNLIRGNQVDANGSRGIFVTLGGDLGAPQNNRFEGNRSTNNASFDVQDQTFGNGTMGTDSVYRGTRCDTSNPGGICVP
jgi:parallel beta-helix repeat protein